MLRQAAEESYTVLVENISSVQHFIVVDMFEGTTDKFTIVEN